MKICPQIALFTIAPAPVLNPFTVQATFTANILCATCGAQDSKRVNDFTLWHISIFI